MRKSGAPIAAEQALDPQRILAPLEGRRGIVLAVSGGPDSTALMLLASRWRSDVPRLVVTVDHGLRAEAAEEARRVREQAEGLGLACRIVTLSGLSAGGNVQERAREARYTSLVIAALDAGCDTIATAHHREDQAETFLIRLKRGSGVYGLAAMAAEGETGGVRLARPLLDVPRAALAALAAESGLDIADDPGNRDPRYDRVRMRRLMPELAASGIDARRLAATARSLRRAADALDHYATALVGEHFSVDAGGAVSGPAEAFAGVPEEVALRAFARLVSAAGGKERVPRLDRLEAAFAGATGGDCRRTLHGAVVEARRGLLRFSREWGRGGLPELAIEPGGEVVWDRRYSVALGRGGTEGLPAPLTVGPLARAGMRLEGGSLAKASVRTMPGLFAGGVLVAVPAGVRAEEGEPLGELAAECIVGPRLRFTQASCGPGHGLT